MSHPASPDAETELSRPAESALVIKTRSLFPEIRLKDGFQTRESTAAHLRKIGAEYSGNDGNALVRPSETQKRLLAEDAAALNIDTQLPLDETSKQLSPHMLDIHNFTRLQKIVGNTLIATTTAWENGIDRQGALKRLTAYTELILARKDARAEEEIANNQKPESPYTKDKATVKKLEEQANKLPPEEFAEIILAGHEAANKIKAGLTDKLTFLGNIVSEAESTRMRLAILRKSLASASQNQPPQV